jgi:hypothetical protein
MADKNFNNNNGADFVLAKLAGLYRGRAREPGRYT